MESWITDNKIPLGRWISDFVDLLNDEADWVFQLISDGLGFLIEGLIDVMAWFPPLALIAVFALIAWFLQRSWKLVLLLVALLLLVVNLGYWQAEGAEVAAGGNRATRGALAKGAFVEPTIFTACKDEMTVVREEVFGPVMAVLDFEDEEEVIARANDTPYGLSAGVFTRDLARGHRTIARLQAGTCWINNYNITPIEMPFGGMKLSGIGRENGKAAIEHYSQVKSVYVELGDVESPY